MIWLNMVALKYLIRLVLLDLAIPRLLDDELVYVRPHRNALLSINH